MLPFKRENVLPRGLQSRACHGGDGAGETADDHSCPNATPLSLRRRPSHLQRQVLASRLQRQVLSGKARGSETFTTP